MDINDLIAMVTEGLPAEEAAKVKAAIERDSVKSKVVTLKAQGEYAALVQKEQELQAALDGGPNKPGAKAYQEWYEKNFAQVQALQVERDAYVKKHGPLEGGTPPNPNPATPPTTYTEADIQRMVDARIQGTYAPKWSELLTGTGSIVQRHMFAGRKAPIDFKAISDLAPKYGGNLEQAYDEWDKPERDKVQAADTEKEIERRVKDEVAKRSVQQQFPGGADYTPAPLSSRTKADIDKFDPAAMKRDLAETFMRGEAPKAS